ncbi:uncharacterized protein C17orf67 homolog isoform X3 [Papio anubis]|nr:uncharacterized protein C17orf67 homolog isoform X3 [Papio anubis]XP_031513393.1 uncharacterized protein C17orf67 homolog isoform X3 [Papio anubis]XP_031513394.1 uncharacterized protein C17orf67 homolog isoform X3 [Papio anubis]
MEHGFPTQYQRWIRFLERPRDALLMKIKSYFDIYGQRPWGGGEREYTLESDGSTRECSNPGSFTMSCANLGIWPNSRAAYHEQPCLLAICRVARGKGLALTIQSFRDLLGSLQMCGWFLELNPDHREIAAAGSPSADGTSFSCLQHQE